MKLLPQLCVITDNTAKEEKGFGDIWVHVSIQIMKYTHPLITLLENLQPSPSVKS